MNFGSVPGINNLVTPVIFTDSNGKIVYKNKSAKTRFPRPMVSADISPLIAPEYKDTFKKIMESGEPGFVMLNENNRGNEDSAIAGQMEYCGITARFLCCFR